MAGNGTGNPALHFAKQMRKERLARGWSFAEFEALTGINAGHLSRIENGRRPPTERVATACDAAFPERRGWFTEYYSELRGWQEVPASFRSWPEFEDRTARLYDWQPGIVTGLLQTEDYARALIETSPGIDAGTVGLRVAARMQRQQRVLFRDDPPRAWFIADELSLFRCVGSPAIMAAQLGHVAEVAALPNVTVQVLPAVAHACNASGFVVADDAAWVEHVHGGFAYSDEASIAEMLARFDSLRGECAKVSESRSVIEELQGIWQTGESPVTAMRAAASALRSARPLPPY
jgi:transcriptional regulator with XRE-family HTH domain